MIHLMLVLGIIGHTLNMYCNRILSIFPNGKLTLADLKTFGKDDKLAKIMEGVSKKVPMRSTMASMLVWILLI
ncbi:hypothetical protein [Fusicatenibacter sp.]|uniref:hypothetical protein n=1 Tax=Fusicatenibacter sp. TaxID=2773922 RepID=UPI00399B0E4B